MNLGELRTAVNRRTGIAVDATALSELVNEAVQAVAEERDWPWMLYSDSFPTQSGTSDYVLPTDWERTVSVTVDGYPTRQINVADADGWDFFEDRPGYYGYAIDGSVLILKPTPTAVATVQHRYVRSEPTLEVDSDEPLIPARFHGAIVNYTAATVCDRYGDAGRADSFRVEYERWFKRMRDATVRSQQPTRVRVRPGSPL